MTDPIDFRTLDRLLSGEAAPDGKDSPLLEALPAALRDEQARAWNTDRAWTRLAARLTSSDARLSGRRVLALVAAVIVLALGLGITYRVWYAPREAAPASLAMREYRTAPGHRDSVLLPDGSRVVLAAASVLRVSAALTGPERAVQLEGEAFFDVAPDAARPFTVFTRNGQTRVLGTSFNVSEYTLNREVEVVVLTGRVLLRPNQNGEGTVLVAGVVGRLGQSGVVTTSNANVSDYTGWLVGRLVFRDKSFAEVVPSLERWYGVNIDVADERLAGTHMTAFFEKQSLEEVLDTLAETLGARYERAGNQIVFSRK